ncbi:MAG: polyphosphate kinase 1 [Fimbriimonadaceae bacterium]|nr:polyphosphate kinase 1 [Fimbriimonadaceae bacterium]
MKASESPLHHPRYLNRELSWIKFNERVLAEAANVRQPLLERVKFLAIFESNLDEFFMVRVSGLFEQVEQGITEETPDGLTPEEQIALITSFTSKQRQEAADLWMRKLVPALTRSRIHLRKVEELSEQEQVKLAERFRTTVFPLLTPILIHPTEKFPFLSNRSLNLAVILKDSEETRVARVKVPDVISRLISVPGQRGEFIWLEDLIQNHLRLLFPGVEVVDSFRFRVIRDADIEIRELEAADLISAVEQTLRLRRFGDPVLLEVESQMPLEWREILRLGLQLDERDVVPVDGLIGLDGLWEVYGLDRSRLKDRPHGPLVVAELTEPDSLFQEIRNRDVLVHHPYDSFRSVETFVNAAALDDQVIGIRQSLYRVGSSSPIVESLLAAAEKGKQVAVMVELKARFDEGNNLVWARALEHAGAHVTYGFRDMKVHSKLCLVVRQENDGIRMYAHIGTGNYNPSTARTYTDLGLFTADPDVCHDILELFNYLTGFSKHADYRKILVAPIDLREGILERIEREIAVHRKSANGHIAIKVNSLVDPEMIDALYEASEAGVRVDLVVRGICCLRPGLPKQSRNIRVVSVVGRLLEHSRVYYFANNGKPEAFIGSADMMRRNLDRRIEVLVPVADQAQIQYLRDEVVLACFRDNQQAWILKPNGEYRRVRRQTGENSFVVQDYLQTRPATRVSSTSPG